MSDTTDDLEYGIDLWADTEADRARVAEWRKGEHTTKVGDIIKIKDMKTSHLENTINYFDWLDTTPLEKELKKRKV